MIKRKIWHLSDFQQTARFMHIVLDKDFHDKFYNTAIEVAGGQRGLAKKLGFYSSRINNYLHHVRRPSLDEFIKISNFLVNNGKSEFSMPEIEKHVTKIKVNGQPVSISPKFPILLNENLVRIVAHIIGDGGITKYFDPFYSNGDAVLLNNFKEYMNQIFGYNALREYGSGNRKIIWYPRIVGKMLIEMFGPFSFGRTSKYIPDILMGHNEKLKVCFLNSLYGDEGSTLPYQLGLYQGKRSSKLLIQVKSMLNELDIKTNNILRVSNNNLMIDPRTDKLYLADEVFVLTISGYKEIIKFKNKVNFPSGSVKENNFLNMLKTRYPKEVKRNKIGETKSLILENIKNKPKTVKEISEDLGFSKRLIYWHLQTLLLENKVLLESGLVKLKR